MSGLFRQSLDGKPRSLASRGFWSSCLVSPAQSSETAPLHKTRACLHSVRFLLRAGKTNRNNIRTEPGGVGNHDSRTEIQEKSARWLNRDRATKAVPTSIWDEKEHVELYATWRYPRHIPLDAARLPPRRHRGN